MHVSDLSCILSLDINLEYGYSQGKPICYGLIRVCHPLLSPTPITHTHHPHLSLMPNSRMSDSHISDSPSSKYLIIQLINTLIYQI